MSAAEVIGRLSEQLGDRWYVQAVCTATQTGVEGNRPTAMFTVLTFTRDGGSGELRSERGAVLFADRQDTRAFPVQPFDAGGADDSEFALTPDGRLHEHSFTWGFTHEIVLDDAGNGVLTGWGESIGNTGVPSLWAIAFGPLLAIPQ